MAKIENPKSWFVKIFTLGKTFSSKTFSDNFKKYFLEFVGLFLVVTFSFYVESIGQEYEDRVRYFDLLSMINNDLHQTNNYLKEYVDLNEWVTDIYNKQYDRWEEDSDSIFIDKEDDFYYAPFSYYTNRDPFNPPNLSFILFEKGTQDFLMVDPETTLQIEDIFNSVDLKYLKINTDDEEKKFIDEFIKIVNSWSEELGDVNIEQDDFWIKNRKYIQKKRELKFNLFNRIQLFKSVNEQLKFYSENIEKSIRHIDSVSLEYRKEKYFLYWKIN